MALPLLLNWGYFGPPMKNDLEPVRLLTIRETAALLQVSTRTVQRLIRGKELRAFKVGARWRVRESELTKWLQGLNER